MWAGDLLSNQKTARFPTVVAPFMEPHDFIVCSTRSYTDLKLITARRSPFVEMRSPLTDKRKITYENP